MKTISTKKALAASLLSLLVCVSMLVGSTFAWFTDTAKTGVNTIQAGTLDVSLEMSTDDGVTWSNAEGQTLQFLTADGRTDILWEPGCTYKLPLLRVVNNGNLSLKYEVVITGINGDAKLNEAIEWTITGTEAGSLAAKATSGNIAISGHMKADAGNDYQGLTIDGISITVYATQYTGESDSEGNVYDTDAAFLNTDEDGNILIGTADELIYFAKTVNVDHTDYTGKTVKLTEDIDLGGKAWAPLRVNAEMTFDGNGKTISNFTATGSKNVGFFGTATKATIRGLTVKNAKISGINHVAAIAGDALCTRIEDCKVMDCEIVTAVQNNDDGDKAGAVAGYLSAEPTAWVKNCTVENCTVKGYRDIGGLVGYANAAAEITGNSVSKVTLCNDRTINYKNYTTDAEYDVNDIVGEYNNNTLDASNTASEITKSNALAASSQENLAEAIAADGPKEVKLSAGAYTLYKVNENKTKNTTLTLQGSGVDNTTFAVGKPVPDQPGEYNADYSFENTDLTFKDMTVNVGTGNYKGIVRASSICFENCVIVGRGSYWGTGKVVFKNCVFISEGDYALWTYSGAEFLFEGCTFRSTVGKFVNAYKEQKTDITVLRFTDCTFISSVANKPAVCLKSKADQEWDVTFTNCNVDACTENADTGSKYYLIELDGASAHPAATKVTVDGTVLWENGAKQ